MHGGHRSLLRVGRKDRYVCQVQQSSNTNIPEALQTSKMIITLMNSENLPKKTKTAAKVKQHRDFSKKEPKKSLHKHLFKPMLLPKRRWAEASYFVDPGASKEGLARVPRWHRCEVDRRSWEGSNEFGFFFFFFLNHMEQIQKAVEVQVWCLLVAFI